MDLVLKGVVVMKYVSAERVLAKRVVIQVVVKYAVRDLVAMKPSGRGEKSIRVGLGIVLALPQLVQECASR